MQCNRAGVHNIPVADTQGNVYTALDQENDAATATPLVGHMAKIQDGLSCGTSDTGGSG